jgi:hypothetical protein
LRQATIRGPPRRLDKQCLLIEVHIQNPARIPDRVMIVYVSTPAPEHYRIDLPEIERPADVSECKEERILVSALTLTRLRS